MHFTVLAIVDGAAADTPQQAKTVAESMLAPFDENLDVEQATEPAFEDFPAETYWHNPRGKWDWYQLGGRWSGHFTIKPGAEHIVHDFGTYPEIKIEPNTADLVRVRDIDFDLMYREAELEAELLYSLFQKAVADTSTDPETFERWVPPYSDEQRQRYWNQPLVAAMKADGFEGPLYWMKPEAFFFGEPDAHDRFVRSRRLAAVSTFAVLDSEGWHDKPGEWGATPEDGEHWNQMLQPLFANLDDDTWLAVFDLHS